MDKKSTTANMGTLFETLYKYKYTKKIKSMGDNINFQVQTIDYFYRTMQNILDNSLLDKLKNEDNTSFEIIY